ncbi:MAG TPA: hypothetical protein VNB91_10755, partial [Jatrophihabitantaceae bacterium]|nr:hypothetical protein [Jatrophihabitantaceae bacterium]
MVWSSATSSGRSRAQRGDRDRAGVIVVVLVDLPGVQEPYPGGQLRRHVQDVFPGGDQLLSQQQSQPAGALDRPGPSRPAPGPLEQPLGLSARRTHPQLPQPLLSRIERDRGMR